MPKPYFHICNPATPEPAGCKNVFSKKELREIKSDDDTIYLVNVHLNWDRNELSNNYGFDVAQLIRTEKKSKVPIIFYSPIDQIYFERKSEKEIKYKILFGRGTGFAKMPFKGTRLTELIKAIKPLSSATLHDLVTMLCDLKGIVIDKLNHDLKFESEIDKVIGTVSPYLSPLQKQLIGLDKFAIEIKQAVKQNDVDAFGKKKEQFILLCNQELTEKGKEKPAIKVVKHNVLLIDDLQKEIDTAKSFLKNEFTIIESTNGAGAIDILKNDSENKIAAVISDWRLFTDVKQNYWQSLQGYEVLDFAANNGIRSLFALTSQADFVVHQLRNLMGIRFSMFKKENLRTADQWKVFADVLFEACSQAVEAKASILDEFPTWNRIWAEKGVAQHSLKQQYIAFWNSINRDSELKSIETKVDDMWNYLITTKNPFLIGETKYKDYSVSIKVLRLTKILALRRIWFALWLNHSQSEKGNAKNTKDLSELVYKKIFGLPGKGSIAQRTINLCIQLDKINSKYMLPEEIAWLTRKGLMG